MIKFNICFLIFLIFRYSDQKDFLMTYLNVPRFDVPEVLIDADDAKIALDIWASVSRIKSGWSIFNKEYDILGTWK